MQLHIDKQAGQTGLDKYAPFYFFLFSYVAVVSPADIPISIVGILNWCFLYVVYTPFMSMLPSKFQMMLLFVDDDTVDPLKIIAHNLWNKFPKEMGWL